MNVFKEGFYGWVGLNSFVYIGSWMVFNLEVFMVFRFDLIVCLIWDGN